jgi:sulfofructose kinase
VIVVERDRGTRTIFYEAKGRVGADVRHPSRRLIESSRVLFVDRFGLPGMIRAARLARSAGIPVVGDFETTDVPRLDELLALVDHLIIPEVAARRLTGRSHPSSAVAALKSVTRQAVVVTCGERGCWFQEAGILRPVHHPAFTVRVVDTTGCGDVFHGAYAAALAQGMELRERVRLASAAAALKATQPGGQRGIPNLRAVRRFLKEQTA